MPFPALLGAYANAGEERNPPAARLSPAYDTFPSPIRSAAASGNTPNGFDFHVYYTKDEIEYASSLRERIRREFPELRIYKFWETPYGPHPTPQFEVNVLTPHETGALFSFLAVYRGPLSVLIHPHTGPGNDVRDHTELASWMGPPLELDLEYLRTLVRS